MIPLRERLLSKTEIDAETGCWNWTAAKDWDGYGHIKVARKTKLSHRVSYEIHCGPISDGMKALHKCDNPSCINPAHLFLGTQADNMADRSAKGRQPVGCNNGQTKLSEADVIAIRAAEGISQDRLAARYGVAQRTISVIKRRKIWRHI